jgi:hypothetical protein
MLQGVGGKARLDALAPDGSPLGQAVCEDGDQVRLWAQQYGVKQG